VTDIDAKTHSRVSIPDSFKGAFGWEERCPDVVVDRQPEVRLFDLGFGRVHQLVVGTLRSSSSRPASRVEGLRDLASVFM